MMKLVLILTILIYFSGCEVDLFNDNKVEQLEKENATLKAQKKAESIQLDYANARVKLEKEQEIERLQLETELQKRKLANEKETTLAEIAHKSEVEKLRIQQELEKEKLAQITAQIAAEKNLELEKYLFGLLGLFMIIVAFFIYYYFKKRREDKLIAYNDNLKKYFYFKESERRSKMAEKVLETIAEGKLSKEDKVMLLKAMRETEIDEVTHTAYSDEIEVELLEEKKD